MLKTTHLSDAALKHSKCVVAQNIYSKQLDGKALLLSKGEPLTERNKQLLNRHGVSWVLADFPDKIWSIDRTRAWEYDAFLEKHQENEKKLEKYLLGIKRDPEKAGCDDVFNFVIDIVENLESPCNIIKYLQFLQIEDERMYQHSINVGLMAYLFGTWIKKQQDELRELTMSALLHDLGKLTIPADILNKRGELTNSEYEGIKSHALGGYEMAARSKFSPSIQSIILSHHEKLDGTGYPLGLKGSEICQNSRIVAVCDVYEALCSKRTYKKRKTPFEAIDIMDNEMFNLLDGEIVYILKLNFARIFQNTTVMLSNGKRGSIVLIEAEDLQHPIIRQEDGEVFRLSKKLGLSITDII